MGTPPPTTATATLAETTTGTPAPILCEQQRDCSVNAWCRDTRYGGFFCHMEGLSGNCPTPHGVAGGAPTPSPAPSPPTTATATLAERTTGTPTPILCDQQKDCSVNAWCRDTHYGQFFCRIEGLSGNCPTPQCVAGGAPTPSPAPSTPTTATATLAETTTGTPTPILCDQ